MSWSTKGFVFLRIYSFFYSLHMPVFPAWSFRPFAIINADCRTIGLDNCVFKVT